MIKIMTKTAKRAAKASKKVARRSRTDAAMTKANQRIDFRVHQKICVKKKFVDVKLAKKKTKNCQGMANFLGREPETHFGCV